MKKRILTVLLLLVVMVAATGAYLLLSGATGFEGPVKYLYIHTGNTSRQEVMNSLRKDDLLTRARIFDLVARQTGYWDEVKPGRYKVPRGTSVLKLVRILQSGRQEPYNMVINKLRTREDLARLMAKYTEADSATLMQTLSHPDTLARWGLDTLSLMSAIIPNTYQVLWTWPPSRVMRKLQDEHQKWWDRNQRRDKAKKLGLSPHEVHVIASIVEEETNKASDKPLIASVYLNRLHHNMPLQADPTVRFARRDFSGNRVYYAHLRYPSPYNTYLNRGLPPGPICTPSPATLDSVLHAPSNDYLYFVARPDFSGYSVFTTNLKDHAKAARTYQDSLDAWLARKAAREALKDQPAKNP